MHGVTLVDNNQMREVQCIVLVPQVGNHQSATLQENFPDHLLSAFLVKYNFPPTPYYYLSSI